jgi:hypothetical protein
MEENLIWSYGEDEITKKGKKLDPVVQYMAELDFALRQLLFKKSHGERNW